MRAASQAPLAAFLRCARAAGCFVALAAALLARAVAAESPPRAAVSPPPAPASPSALVSASAPVSVSASSPDGSASPRSFATGRYRDLFGELLGKSSTEIDARIARAWAQLFQGDPERERVYYESGDGAYIADIGNNDVRTEGMSYGLMLAVQLDHRPEFDRLWRWATRHMRHADGPRAGYFAWHCRFDGTQLSPGSASDGEEWFAMALFFASHRWGDRGAIKYGAEAQALLRALLHQPTTGDLTAIFNRSERQVTFVPSGRGSRFTDPSYHLPAFYELWSRWARDPADRAYWAEAAATSRAFFRRAAHPETGLMPEYAAFDGSPFAGFGADKVDFRYDAWRTLANVALDHAWFGADPWPVEQSNRVLRFLARHAPNVPNQFALDGKPLATSTSPGLLAMAAAAGLAADPATARPWAQRLWDLPVPSGRWRYYDGMLYFLALLEVSGRFRIYAPAP